MYFGISLGIAFELSKSGAIVYATGRQTSSRDQVKGAGTLDDLVNEAAEVGGKIIPVLCDHTNDQQVRDLFQQIKQEQDGRLDVLVNNAVANVVVSSIQPGILLYASNQVCGQEHRKEVL